MLGAKSWIWRCFLLPNSLLLTWPHALCSQPGSVGWHGPHTGTHLKQGAPSPLWPRHSVLGLHYPASGNHCPSLQTPQSAGKGMCASNPNCTFSNLLECIKLLPPELCIGGSDGLNFSYSRTSSLLVSVYTCRALVNWHLCCSACCITEIWAGCPVCSLGYFCSDASAVESIFPHSCPIGSLGAVEHS